MRNKSIKSIALVRAEKIINISLALSWKACVSREEAARRAAHVMAVLGSAFDIDDSEYAQFCGATISNYIVIYYDEFGNSRLDPRVYIERINGGLN